MLDAGDKILDTGYKIKDKKNKKQETKYKIDDGDRGRVLSDQVTVILELRPSPPQILLRQKDGGSERQCLTFYLFTVYFLPILVPSLQAGNATCRLLPAVHLFSPGHPAFINRERLTVQFFPIQHFFSGLRSPVSGLHLYPASSIKYLFSLS